MCKEFGYVFRPCSAESVSSADVCVWDGAVMLQLVENQAVTASVEESSLQKI